VNESFRSHQSGKFDRDPIMRCLRTGFSAGAARAQSIPHDVPAVASMRIRLVILQAFLENLAVPFGNSDAFRRRHDSLPQCDGTDRRHLHRQTDGRRAGCVRAVAPRISSNRVFSAARRMRSGESRECEPRCAGRGSEGECLGLLPVSLQPQRGCIDGNQGKRSTSLGHLVRRHDVSVRA